MAWTTKSPNGTRFRSGKLKEHCEQNGIVLQKVIPKWAQANGEVWLQNASLLKRMQISQAERKPWRV